MRRRAGPLRTARSAAPPAVVLAAALLGGPEAAAAQASGPAFDAEAFDAWVREAVDVWDAPGLAVAIVKDGEVVFERGYGVLRVGEPAAVDEDTRFAIGSTTKAMTAAAIGMLVDEGKLDWDDPASDHLPALRFSDPHLTTEVTVRDLLTHRAGLGNADLLWYGRETTAAEIMERIRHIPVEYSLRSSFIYQNIMYLAAGEIVAAVSGMPWEDFVRTRIFEPLGMRETVALVSRTEGGENVASPHDYVDGELVAIENASVDPVAPAGSVWSSVHDMAKWLNLLLAEGTTPDGERILREATVAELFRPQVVQRSQYPTDRLTRPSFQTYGLGWFQQDYRGRKIDFHTGSIDGMIAIAGLMRDEELGVYVLGNRDHVEVRHAIMYRVFDLFDRHGPPRDWSAELKELYDGVERSQAAAADARRSAREEGTRPSRALEAYAGTYSDPLYGEIVISEDGDGLRFHAGPGLEGPLEHWHYDTFVVRYDAAWRGESFVTFRLDAGGGVAALETGGTTFTRQR